MYESDNYNTIFTAHLNAIKFTCLVKNTSIIVRIGLIQHIKTCKKVATRSGKPVLWIAFKNYSQETIGII